MSPLWRDRLIAVLAPDRVVLVRRRPGWRGAPELLAQAPCAAPTAPAAVDALRTLLSRPDLGRAELSVLMSSHFVQFLLVPWRGQLGRPAELAAFAAICFDETFGSEPARRVVLAAGARAGSARVAAALDPELLAALRSAAAQSRLRLASLQPYLCALFDRLHRRLAARDFIFLAAEPTRSCVLVASDGRWRSLRSTATAATPRELANLVEREAQLAGLADQRMPPVFVHAAGHGALQLPACHGVVPTLLPAPAASAMDHGPGEALFAMALTVA